MSALTMHQLLAANPEPFHRAAVAWARLAKDIDEAYEQFVGGLRQVDRAWPAGQAAGEAIRKLTAQGHELSNIHNPARRIADALERHAYGVGELRLRAEEAILAVELKGIHVDRVTGHVSAPASMFSLGEAEVTGRAISLIVRDLADLLERAQRLDDETATVIRSNVPAPGHGFGSQLAWHVTADLVAQQQGKSPEQVHAWWQSLSPEQQEQVIREYPELLGGLDGVPATDRDRANRVNLVHQLGDLEVRQAELGRQVADAEQAYLDALAQGQPGAEAVGRRAGELRAQLDQARAEEAGLRKVQETLAKYGDRALLMGIDGTGDGRAIISLGDPDQARHTAVFVPGVNTDLLDVGGDMDRVRHLQEAADALTPEHDDVAVIMWLGYDAPTVVDALSYEDSYQGAKAFTPFVDGLRATHDLSNEPYHVTAVGHSYGSTVIAESALSGGLQVDDIITAGSPGMHTDRAENLNIDPRHVWAGRAEGDDIGGGWGDFWFVHGQEPSDPTFGGNRFEVDTTGHSGYWTENSDSLLNQAYIIVGRYDWVGYYYGSAPKQ